MNMDYNPPTAGDIAMHYSDVNTEEIKKLKKEIEQLEGRIAMLEDSIERIQSAIDRIHQE